MKHLPLLWLLCILIGLWSASGNVNAAVISEQTFADTGVNNAFVGQSLTTGAGGPWSDLTFHWFAHAEPNGDASQPVAFGELFILSSQYSGSPAGLSSATPGFKAKSTGIASNEYVFAASTTLAENTTYYFYTNQPGTIVGSLGSSVGDFFESGAPNVSFGMGSMGDAAFRLKGEQSTSTAVPEPSTIWIWVLLGLTFTKICLPKKRKKL